MRVIIALFVLSMLLQPAHGSEAVSSQHALVARILALARSGLCAEVQESPHNSFYFGELGHAAESSDSRVLLTVFEATHTIVLTQVSGEKGSACTSKYVEFDSNSLQVETGLTWLCTFDKILKTDKYSRVDVHDINERLYGVRWHAWLQKTLEQLSDNLNSCVVPR
jgi:hypothetical protein